MHLAAVEINAKSTVACGGIITFRCEHCFSQCLLYRCSHQCWPVPCFPAEQRVF